MKWLPNCEIWFIETCLSSLFQTAFRLAMIEAFACEVADNFILTARSTHSSIPTYWTAKVPLVHLSYALAVLALQPA